MFQHSLLSNASKTNLLYSTISFLNDYIQKSVKLRPLNNFLNKTISLEYPSSHQGTTNSVLLCTLIPSF